jgi:hypothetical protein
VSVAGLLLFIKVTVKRCDRILWKTTVIPEPIPQNIHDSTTRPQTRVSQFMDAFRSPSRNLPDSSAPKHLAPSSSYVISGKLEARNLRSGSVSHFQINVSTTKTCPGQTLSHPRLLRLYLPDAPQRLIPPSPKSDRILLLFLNGVFFLASYRPPRHKATEYRNIQELQYNRHILKVISCASTIILLMIAKCVGWKAEVTIDLL